MIQPAPSPASFTGQQEVGRKLPAGPGAPGAVSGASPWWRRLLLGAAVLGLWLLFSWPRPAYGSGGGSLFEAHCAGCHVNGGNILRRGKTLKLAALERNGISGPEAIAAIASEGIGQMGGYGEVLGEGGAELVGDWVWQQALRNWARQSDPPQPLPPSG